MAGGKLIFITFGKIHQKEIAVRRCLSGIKGAGGEGADDGIDPAGKGKFADIGRKQHPVGTEDFSEVIF